MDFNDCAGVPNMASPPPPVMLAETQLKTGRKSDPSLNGPWLANGLSVTAVCLEGIPSATQGRGLYCIEDRTPSMLSRGNVDVSPDQRRLGKTGA